MAKGSVRKAKSGTHASTSKMKAAGKSRKSLQAQRAIFGHKNNRQTMYTAS